MLNVKEASEELKQKNYWQIQEETAWKWASRAAASYQACLTKEKEDKLVFFSLGEEYLHEAIEHAALGDNQKNLISEIRLAIAPYQDKAADFMNGSVPST